jgi:thioesterase domain-containing protein
VLGGHCYGGIVAFEIARQLLAAGQDIRMVVLFEVPTPGYPKVARHWKKYFQSSAAVALGFLRRDRRLHWEQARAHLSVWNGLFRRKRQAVTRRALFSAGMQAAIAPMEPVELRNERAGRAYIPRRIECDVAHFLAADEHHSTLILDDARLGWRDVAGREVSIHWVPGIKDRIFLPPNVGELAKQLQPVLDRVTPRI